MQNVQRMIAKAEELLLFIREEGGYEFKISVLNVDDTSALLEVVVFGNSMKKYKVEFSYSEPTDQFIVQVGSYLRDVDEVTMWRTLFNTSDGIRDRLQKAIESISTTLREEVEKYKDWRA